MFKLKLVNKPKMMKLKCNFTFPDIVLANLQEKEATPTKEVQEIVADVPYDGLSKVIIDKIPDDYIIPSGEITITENGAYDVKESATAKVDVISDDNAKCIVDPKAIANLSDLITKLPLLNGESITSLFGMSSSRFYELVNWEGIKNIGQAYVDYANENYGSYTVYASFNKLSHESLVNIINNLYDIKTKGVKPQKLILGSTNLAKLTAEEIAVATNKGWNVS